MRARLSRRLSIALVGAITLAIPAVAPGTAAALPPTCTDMNVSVPHNAATPILINCSGGSSGSPDVLVASDPSKGTVAPAAGGKSADQWVVYTPDPGQSGADSFTYRGVSTGTGSFGTDEIGSEHTVDIRIGPGSPPVCSNLSQSVSQAIATKLRLSCATGGDPISSFSVSNLPDNGSINTSGLNSGLVSYTSNAGYTGQDFFGYRLTSSCGAASCQSAEATFELQVLDPQQGPAGADGADGATGTPGKDGAPGSVVTVDRLFIASYLDGLTARRGKPVILRYVSTTQAQVMLEVFKGARRVSAAVATARAGKNAIRWNGKVDGKKAPRGLYRLRLKATSGDQVATDKATIRLR